jgi:hypothetical protein
MRPFMRFLGVFLVALGVAACRVGPNPSRSPLATSPFGAQVELEVVGSSTIPGTAYDLRGRLELLSITDSGLLVDNGAVIVLVRFGAFNRATLKDAPGVKPLNGYPTRQHRESARKYSRYPFGLTEEQMNSLLADRNQEGLIIVGQHQEANPPRPPSSGSRDSRQPMAG